jgi:hypothetical protein
MNDFHYGTNCEITNISAILDSRLGAEIRMLSFYAGLAGSMKTFVSMKLFVMTNYC